MKNKITIYYPNLPYKVITGVLFVIYILGSLLGFLAGSIKGDEGGSDCKVHNRVEILFYPSYGLGCYLFESFGKTDG